MARTPGLGIVPRRKRAKPRAEKMTSVDTSTVEEAMEVHLRDSNQAVKWNASSRPLRAQKRKSRPVAALSSSRCRNSTEGRSSSTAQPSRQVAVTREGAADQRTKIEEKEAPRTPRKSPYFGLNAPSRGDRGLTGAGPAGRPPGPTAPGPAPIGGGGRPAPCVQIRRPPGQICTLHPETARPRPA